MWAIKHDFVLPLRGQIFDYLRAALGYLEPTRSETKKKKVSSYGKTF